jgi:hypothetical protein
MYTLFGQSLALTIPAVCITVLLASSGVRTTSMPSISSSESQFLADGQPISIETTWVGGPESDTYVVGGSGVVAAGTGGNVDEHPAVMIQITTSHRKKTPFLTDTKSLFTYSLKKQLLSFLVGEDDLIKLNIFGLACLFPSFVRRE